MGGGPGVASTVFVGTSAFAAEVLAHLAASEAQRPALVLTRPDRPRGRGRRVAPPPVAERARSLGIPLEQPQSINDEHARELISRAGRTGRLDADAHSAGITLVVCAFGALITEPLLSEHEILNIHPSLLPRWRGAAPIERAIMAGDERTGVSIMRLTAGLDSGPVCLVASEGIRAEDTYGSLTARLEPIAGSLISQALSERPPFREQPEQGITYAEKIAPGDRTLDPARRAAELERVVRALDPHIGARVALPDATMLGVRRAAISDTRPPAPGGVGVREDRLLLGCADGALELLVVQPPGGRAMDASAYLRGRAAAGLA